MLERRDMSVASNLTAHAPSVAQALARGRDVWLVFLLLLVATCAAIACGGQVAQADDGDSAFDSHLVQTVMPSNTTVNLFDYWTKSGDNDYSQDVSNNRDSNNEESQLTAGINNSNHQLKFNGGNGNGINKWTHSSTPLSFVDATLGSDGYPQIKAGTYSADGTSGTVSSESLGYLFNSTSYAAGTQDGKETYLGVTGLFQVEDGYYVYDSSKNFASYDKAANELKVYDASAVSGSFFPFNTAGSVFTTDWSGNLTTKSGLANDSDGVINHHFGLSMSTQFTHPAGGKVNDGSDMVFEFSGDDDVWVYIDGVLVGDVGGIHDASSLNINFRTGKVTVSGKADTTLKALFKKAGVSTEGFAGDTFADDTQHSLAFFYLERGAYASNMKIKFNLTSVPISDVYKIDQNGEPVSGAMFGLYYADEDYNAGDLIATGTTDVNGQLLLTKANGAAISFDQEAANGRYYYVLREVSLPDGYRTGLYNTEGSSGGRKELHLEYVKSENVSMSSGTGGTLVSPNDTVGADSLSRHWLNGGYVAANETLTVSGALEASAESASKSIVPSTATGTLFAVVLRNTGGTWTPVKGNATDGYELCATGIAGAVEAAQASATQVFSSQVNGKIQATVNDLPGDITEYAYMMSDPENAKYVVAVYYTTADSLAGATEGNTVRVESSGFTRQFSCSLHITNIQNRLWVQKVDEVGSTVNGAEFALYTSDQVNVDADGNVSLKQGVGEPYDTAVTTDIASPYALGGAACFPVDSAGHKPLVTGQTYYLKETKAPEGYTVNDAFVKIVVQDDGVYAYAGDEGEGDGIATLVGPGSLIAGMAQFGSNGAVDNTLAWVEGAKQVGTETGGQVTWGDVSSEADETLHLKYNPDNSSSVLRYTDLDGNLPYVVCESGWNRLALFQDEVGEGASAGADRDDLGDLQLNQLFTTSVGVRVTDARVASLEVSKEVADFDASYGVDVAGANFYFQLTLPEAPEGAEGYYATISKKASDPAAADQVVGKLTVRSGDVVMLRDDETLQVFGLPKGATASVEELYSDTRTTRFAAGQGVAGDGAEAVAAADAEAADVEAAAPATDSGAGDAAEAQAAAPADAPAAAVANEPQDITSERVVNSEEDQTPTDGFHLTNRWLGSAQYQPAAGEADDVMSCTIVSPGVDADGTYRVDETNQLRFVNAYEPTPATLTAQTGFTAKKVLTGRDWQEGDAFTIRLIALNDAPMPEGAEMNEAAYVVDKTVTSADEAASVYFGDITYTKPGTYEYAIDEVRPSSDKQDPGIDYSDARYHVSVRVVDNGKGKLEIDAVTMEQQWDDAGKDLGTESDQGATPDSSDSQAAADDAGPAAEAGEAGQPEGGTGEDAAPVLTYPAVEDKVAVFTNVYDEYEDSVSVRAIKSYSGFQLASGDFAFKLKAVGSTADAAWSFDSLDKLKSPSLDTASEMPMPGEAADGARAMAAPGTAVSQTNNGTAVSFAAMRFSTVEGDVGKTYVYELTEDASVQKVGVTYDQSVYYLVVRCEAAGAGINVTRAYYRVQEGKPVLQRGDEYQPVFVNSYATAPVSTDIRVQKTLQGRAWQDGETFTFMLEAADDATRAAMADGVVYGFSNAAAGNEKTTATAIVNKPQATVGADGQVVEPASPNVSSASFALVPETGITFTKAGTYTFNVTEVGGSAKGLTYDGHSCKVTCVVTDENAALRVAVTYDNGTSSMSGSDKANSSIAAFTNIYRASGTYSGVDITKTLNGRSQQLNEFTFNIQPLAYNGYEDPSFDSRNAEFHNNYGVVSGEASFMYRNAATGERYLSGGVTQGALGQTYLFRVSERESGTTQDSTSYDTAYTGAAYVLITPYADPSDASKLYMKTTIVKGPDVTALIAAAALGDSDDYGAVLTEEAIDGLDATRNYVRSWDSRTSSGVPRIDFVNDSTPPRSTTRRKAASRFGRSLRAREARPRTPSSTSS